MQSRFVTIGVAARESGVPEWRLRAWETSGLLTPSRTPSGYRVFSAADIERATQLATELDGAERLHAVGLAYAASQGVDPLSTAPEPAGSAADHRTVQFFGVLHQITHQLQASDDIRASLAFVVAQVARAMGADAASVTLADLVRQKIDVYCTFGLSKGFTKALEPWRIHQGLGGQVFALRQPISVPDLRAGTGVGREMIHSEGLRAYACVPLLRGSRRIGILEMYKRTPEPFTVDELGFLEMVAGLITPYIETGLLEQQLGTLQQERVRHFRTLVSQFSGTARRQREHFATELRTIAEQYGSPDSAVEREHVEMLLGLAQRAEGVHAAEFDFLDLVRESIIDRLSHSSGLSCSVELGSWPTTLSTSFASRLYLLLVRLVDEIAVIADDHLLVLLDSSPEEITVSIDFGTSVKSMKDPFTPSVEAAENIAELDGALRAVRGTASSSLSVSIPRHSADHRADLLTQRERETLEALRSGLSNREIATTLQISSKTLQNHLTAIYRKLQVSNRSEAIGFAADAAS